MWQINIVVWRDDVSWINQPGSRPGKPRPSHLTRSATDAKYRSRLCSHWDKPQECHFRKKGKCDFAHGPLELRVKDTRRDKWGHNNKQQQQQQQQNYQNGGTTASSCNVDSSAILLLQMQNRYSGGEDVLGAARSIEKVINCMSFLLLLLLLLLLFYNVGVSKNK